jgi:hypothetical protein
LGAVLLAVLANLYIIVARPFGATLGIPIDQTEPVGAVIAAIVPYVWLFLYAGMGTTFWLLAGKDQRMSGRAWLVVALVLLCVGYPVYTGSLNQPIIALIGNGVVVAVAAISVWVDLADFETWGGPPRARHRLGIACLGGAGCTDHGAAVLGPEPSARSGVGVAAATTARGVPLWRRDTRPVV